MEKVYCSLCEHCDCDNMYGHPSFYKCRSPKNIVDTFFGKECKTVYCDRKNYRNDCPDFELDKRIARKQKRKEWFNNLKNTLYDKARTGALRCCTFLSKRFKIGSASSSES